jgi:hypothetical protein
MPAPGQQSFTLTRLLPFVSRRRVHLRGAYDGIIVERATIPSSDCATGLGGCAAAGGFDQWEPRSHWLKFMIEMLGCPFSLRVTTTIDWPHASLSIKGQRATDVGVRGQ